MESQSRARVSVPDGDGAEALRRALAPLEAIADVRIHAGSAGGEEELALRLAGARVAISWLGRTRLTRGVLERAQELRLISVVGPWLENIDLTAAERLGIRVMHAPGAAIPAVAELAV